MKPLHRALVAANLIVLLAWFAWTVREKEILISEGDLLLFELAPVDPRSLIQGDYMTLRYAIAASWPSDSLPKTGFLIVTKGENNVAQRQRLQSGLTPLAEGEYPVNYTASRWRINIGAESYFFQEGHAERYENAKYGGLRVDGKGNSLLEGLYDEDFQLLR
ncbi:GDYXXLXY domain-containing protein [Neolewinella aurantiaca]|uniref:GDYXXLXY domain-containing protein n=1 Tax=Neolewinella aurantiaca TaxID=2602767 RepID=A0A5C7FH23_9BACT|nr:GDYXXLXY domain-containing protein [Neolewinella aurantiaca]TXF89704.1 GDYXXLXY domain-containing protein [Neolewinella aurantiaca]